MQDPKAAAKAGETKVAVGSALASNCWKTAIAPATDWLLYNSTVRTRARPTVAWKHLVRPC